jgi:hypothetical protein
MGAETGESVGVDVALILIDSGIKTERQSSETSWFKLQAETRSKINWTRDY